ncbi:HdeD family acid-resistance protein [Natronosalvus rutilus]|uniref:DUF308 domain-containing protein n=1 Tax=Natronosalvus rutilus TaxID=2953753 RepID=A0A9E7NEI5_9EURY|nr:DUF308 domain-containing protein [Natronosalvus rutilus]UTF55312.1 DUF308 domain-containing protein [Natronosalvus rutilus]
MSTVTTESGMGTTNWRPLAYAGSAIVLIGLLAIALPFATGLAVTYLLGGLLVVGGIAHAGHAFTTRDWKGSLWQATLAGISIAAGLLLFVNPIVGLASLTLLVIAYLLVDGFAELALALQMAGEAGRGWIAASGTLSLILAGLLWAGFPSSAAWVVGFVVGASLLATGISMIAVAYRGRSAGEDMTPPATSPRGA